jgi:hypothetical protein
VALRESYPNIELHLGDAHPTAARRMLREAN